MNAPDVFFAPDSMRTLPDVQSSPDQREIAIQKVGVRDVRYPVRLRGAGTGDAQPSIGTFQMTVALPPHVKGTHMSRFIEVLEAHDSALDAAGLERLLDTMLGRLGATAGAITMQATYFRRKVAPVSGVASLLDYGVTLHAERDGAHRLTRQSVDVPVTSLCPCSRDISDYGAHNQRSRISIGVELRGALGLDEQIAVAENSASCQLWGLLKRPDEKYVTEYAYDHPKFVEDLVRDVAVALRGDARVAAYTVASENFESIHNHSAYAWLQGRNR